MRHVALLAVLAFSACSSAPRNAATPAGGTAVPEPAAPPSDASPADVYLLYDALLARLGAELEQAGEKLEAVRAAGSEEEFERAKNEILEAVDPDALIPFLSDVQVQELAALPVADRRMVHVMNIDPSLRPSRVEILNETTTDSRATLHVRGQFDTPMIGEPGWRTGTITLVREESGWKVDDESWGQPRSGEDDAPRGRFEVSGAVDAADEAAGMSSSRWASYGGGWGFSMHDEASGYVVLFSNIPGTIAPGEYPLADRPSIPGNADPATLAFPFSATLGRTSDSGGFDKTWDENVTGTVTVEAIEVGRMSGRFEFTADASIGSSVTVRGSFRNVVVPEP